MKYLCSQEVIAEVGADAAIVLENIVHWCNKNKANEKNIHDGKAWTYNSMRAFQEMFPFSSSKVRSCLKKLKDNGYVETGNFNKSAYDRTLWYAATPKAFVQCGYSICDNEQIHLSKNTNEFAQNDEPIPDINTKEKTQVINTNNRESDFEAFWKAFPNKKNKGQARKTWAKHIKAGTLPDIDTILAAIETCKGYQGWKDGYVPHPSTWLNAEAWHDEANTSTSTPAPVQEIVDLYHEILPELNKVKEITPSRVKDVQARWDGEEKRQSLDYWTRFFRYVKSCPILMGEAGNPFKADFGWLVTQDNFVKVIEGRYRS